MKKVLRKLEDIPAPEVESADGRATRLLFCYLTLKQRETYMNDGYIRFWGSSRGSYCIHLQSYRVILCVTGWRDRHRSMCLTVAHRGYLPAADHVLAILARLMTNERGFRKESRALNEHSHDHLVASFHQGFIW